MQARGIRGASVPTKAKLTFFQDQSLQLQLQYKSTDAWTDCFKIDTSTSDRSFKMPTTTYLGFSAHTGELSDNFDIVSVETRNLYNPQGATAMRGPNVGTRAKGVKPKKKSGGWGWFFFKIMMFGLVCGGGYFGWLKYKEHQKNQRYKGF